MTFTRKSDVRGLSILAIVDLGKVQILSTQANDRIRGLRLGDRLLGPAAAVGKPFSEEAIVLGATLIGAVGAKVKVLATQGDNGLTTFLVETVLGVVFRYATHVQTPS